MRGSSGRTETLAGARVMWPAPRESGQSCGGLTRARQPGRNALGLESGWNRSFLTITIPAHARRFKAGWPAHDGSRGDVRSPEDRCLSWRVRPMHLETRIMRHWRYMGFAAVAAVTLAMAGRLEAQEAKE